MKKKVVEEKEVSRIKKAPIQKPEVVYVQAPGKTERMLMFLARVLRILLKFMEKKIQTIKAHRLAKRMDRSDSD